MSTLEGPDGRTVAVVATARALLWLVALLPILLCLPPHDLWAPEEPRFGRVAHEMATEGDWLVTRLNGLPDAEKPPLLFWMMAAAEQVAGGPSPLPMRLPGALLACLATFATASLTRRWFRDRALADTAGILFGTTLLAVWNAPRAGMDLGLAAFSAIALEGASAAIAFGSFWGVVRLGLGIGLGFLLKGPHALLVPLCGAIGGAFLARRRSPDEPPLIRKGATLRVLAGTVLGLAIFGAWLVPALAWRGDEMTALKVTFRERLVGQLGRRVTGTKEPHLHGPLFLLLVLPLAALPWTPFAALGAWIAARRERVAREDLFGLGAALGAIVLPLLLLSIPASKRETYLIPLLPAAAALAAYVLHRAPQGRIVRAGVRSLIGGLAVLGAIALLLPVLAPTLGPRLYKTNEYDAVTSEVFTRGPIVVACVAVGLAGLAAAWFVARARAEPVRAARRTALSIVVLAVGGAFAFLPTFDPTASFADAVVVARRDAPGAAFHVAGTSDPSALWAFGFHRTGYIDDHATLAATLAPDAPRALVLAKGNFWTRRAALAKAEDLPKINRARVLWERRVGAATWHLLTNAPP
jgi:4-amino-4-deoxy-L-arabinose transferase-like glycosyltransferase